MGTFTAAQRLVLLDLLKVRRATGLHAAGQQITDGRKLVDESWSEEQTQDELTQIANALHTAVEFEREPDYAAIGRIVAGTAMRYAEKAITPAALEKAETEVRECAAEARAERWAA